MPNSRLLTGLFVTASVVVDLVLLAAVMGNPDESRYQALLEGLALGQVGALAIWTVTGRPHRLARGAVLVVATGILAVVTVRERVWYVGSWLALLAIYAVIVMAAVGMIEFFRRAWNSKLERQESLHVPLIELFGWTIIVAIASFGARFMDFRVVEHGLSKLPTTLTVVAIPVLVELLHRPRFDPRHVLSGASIVALAYAMGYYLMGRPQLPLTLAMQAAYLAAWSIVRSVESEETADRETPIGDTQSE